MNHTNTNPPRFHAYLSCRDLGVGCDFEVSGPSTDDVIQRCADHAAREHGMKGFGPALYTKLRGAVKVIDAPIDAPKDADASHEAKRDASGRVIAAVGVSILLATTLLLTAFTPSSDASAAQGPAPVQQPAPIAARATCAIPSDTP